jgi:hypothetical protein
MGCSPLNDKTADWQSEGKGGHHENCAEDTSVMWMKPMHLSSRNSNFLSKCALEKWDRLSGETGRQNARIELLLFLGIFRGMESVRLGFHSQQ